MAHIKIAKSVTIRVNDVATVHYPEGFEGSVPKDHAERIEAAGAGKAGERAPAKADDKAASS